MGKSLPPLTWFRSFEASARTLSFTAAAQEIGLTQSAVSQQVKSLEVRLGVPLFERRARGLALTDEGRKLLPQVGSAMETLTMAARAFDAAPSAQLLTVATSVSVAQWVIAPRLSDFTARHPKTRVRLLSAIWPDDFHSRRAEVEIRFGSEKQIGKDAEPLRPDRLVALKSTQTRGRLEDLPLIEAVGTSSGWNAWADAFGGSFQPSCYADTYGMALQLAAHGNGVALVSELLSGYAINSGIVDHADAGSIPCQESYYISVDAGIPSAVHFRRWLMEQL